MVSRYITNCLITNALIYSLIMYSINRDRVCLVQEEQVATTKIQSTRVEIILK